MAEGKNSIVDIKNFLSTPERPVGSKEMSDFWSSLTEEEKLEFKNTELPK